MGTQKDKMLLNGYQYETVEGMPKSKQNHLRWLWENKHGGKITYKLIKDKEKEIKEKEKKQKLKNKIVVGLFDSYDKMEKPEMEYEEWRDMEMSREDEYDHNQEVF